MLKSANALLRTLSRWYSVPLVLLLWEALVVSGAVPERLMPNLVTIGKAFAEGVANGDILHHSAITLGRALTGFVLAVAAGVLFGTLMAQSLLVKRLFEPSFFFTYPVPKIALYPIFTFIFGLGSWAKIAFVFVECLYPITINTYYGMRSTDRIKVWTALNMGASSKQIFWKLLIPSSAPYIFSGIRVALPISLIVVIITEMIGDSTGLGFYITYAAASFQYKFIYAGIMAIAIWGFILDRIIVFLRNRVVFWERETAPIA